jgi:hypothetical protein
LKPYQPLNTQQPQTTNNHFDAMVQKQNKHVDPNPPSYSPAPPPAEEVNYEFFKGANDARKPHHPPIQYSIQVESPPASASFQVTHPPDAAPVQLKAPPAAVDGATVVKTNVCSWSLTFFCRWLQSSVISSYTQ